VRDRELEHVVAANLDLERRVAVWREQHPDGTLRDAVADLELWPKNPADPDAQRLVWIALRRVGDPLAERLGFTAMRRMSVPAAANAATGCTAGTPQPAGEMR
jgi:hypothetical protein